MLDALQQIDVFLFYLINVRLQNEFLDWFMPFITEKQNWYPVFLAIYIILIWPGGKKGRIVAVLTIPLIFMSDQFSASVLKEIVARTRPCVALENVHLLTGMKTSFSFPSSHAANTFAAAAFFAYYYPNGKMLYFALAILVGFSRIYVGVHYPLDVIGGQALGFFCAVILILAYKFAEKLYTYSRWEFAKNKNPMQ